MSRRVILGALVLVAACGQYETEIGPLPSRKLASPPPADQVRQEARAQAQAAAEANRVFAERCTPCHGAQGFGNGDAAASLPTHPRNFHDVHWQASVDDRHIETIIVQGGPSVGKSELMPSNPDLVEKPAIISALRLKIRAFGRSNGS